MGQLKRNQEFVFVANHPCLDFVNTQLVIKGALTDVLDTFEDLVAWLVESHQLRKQDAEAANRQLSHDEKAVILEQAKTFRATLRNMVQHIVERKRCFQNRSRPL